VFSIHAERGRHRFLNDEPTLSHLVRLAVGGPDLPPVEWTELLG
jgi:hypothetical protein